MDAATSRTSTLRTRTSPTRSISRSCSTRSSLPCAGSGRLLISSRNSVPPWARSKRPGREWSAPVKAPFSTPNSSDSTRSGGIAAQLIDTIGCSCRRLTECSARAKRSLPTPLSPRNSTVESVTPTRRTRLATALKPAEVPTKSSNSPGTQTLAGALRVGRAFGGVRTKDSIFRKLVSCSLRSSQAASGRPTTRQRSWPIATHSISRHSTGCPRMAVQQPLA
ncbi:hypothetical protein X551_04651 [Methylibium sp. T29]|nr:hypothetical protein X551_04651 [Methylibium sp. T29]